ncbi:UNVERIFIED_CONTAM: Barrier-to-autointegration factor [Gekko kuhli]
MLLKEPKKVESIPAALIGRERWLEGSLSDRAAAKMTTSQKRRDFVAESMGEKSVGTLSGLGDVLGKKLEDKGFDKAYVVLGQFLVLKKD